MDSVSSLIGIGAALGRDVERLRARVAAAGVAIEKSTPTQFVIATTDPNQKIVISLAVGTPRENVCEAAWVDQNGVVQPGTQQYVGTFADLLKLLGR